MITRFTSSKWAAFVKSTNIIAYIVAFTALAYGYNANSTALDESNNRAEAIETQLGRLQYAFCPLEKYANYPAPPASAQGAELRDALKRITSPEGIGCTPDINDNR